MALSLCRDCHQEISTEAPFCPHCGAPCRPAMSYVFSEPEQTQTFPESPQQRQDSARRVKRKKYGLLGIALAFFLVVGLMVRQTYWRGNESASEGQITFSRLKHFLLSSFLYGHQSAVYSVAFSPDGKTLASGSADKTIILWDLGTRQPIDTLSNGPAVACLAFSPDGKTLAAGTWDRNIILWDVGTRQPIGPPLTGHTDAVFNVAFSPGGKTLASASGDKTITLWDLATRQPLGLPLTGHGNWVSSLAFSPDGKTLASASGDTTVIFWDVASRRPLGPPLAAHQGPVLSLAFSPDGKTLASGSDDKSIILWEVKKRQPRSRLREPCSAVLSLAFHPDGKTLAAGTLEETIILLDVATGQTIGAPLARHDSAVLGLAFSPDGKTLASSSQDKTVLLWDLAEKSWLVRAYHNLTQEWRRHVVGDLKTSQGPKEPEDKTDLAGK